MIWLLVLLLVGMPQSQTVGGTPPDRAPISSVLFQTAYAFFVDYVRSVTQGKL